MNRRRHKPEKFFLLASQGTADPNLTIEWIVHSISIHPPGISMNPMEVISPKRPKASPPIDFAWLELTNRCNLGCVHCYAESGPWEGESDGLSGSDHEELIGQLAALGCRKIQFIGGEPTLNRNLARLIAVARGYGFELVEVFTNLTHLSESLLEVFIAHRVSVATSFYSPDPAVQDAITGREGSHARTVDGIRRVLAAGLSLRAGIILMDSNREDADATAAYLKTLGVEKVGFDRVRAIGRAEDAGGCSMGELCGECAGRILAISPNGEVSPCTMARAWNVGSVREQSLESLVQSKQLANVRRRIRKEVKARRLLPEAVCAPKTCAPYETCGPSNGACNPCAPNGCSPCFPKG